MKTRLEIAKEINYKGKALRTIRVNENRILSEVIMDRDKLLTELYNSRVMNEIRKEYRNTGKEIQNLRNKITELENLFRSEESYSLTVKEYFDKSDELKEYKEQLNIKEIERKVWDHAREICMDLADEVADDVN